jgi:hypothetical protein
MCRACVGTCPQSSATRPPRPATPPAPSLHRTRVPQLPSFAAGCAPKKHTSYAPGSQAVTSRSESEHYGHSTYCGAPAEPVVPSTEPVALGRTQQLGGKWLQRVQVISYSYGVPVLEPVEGALLEARAAQQCAPRAGLYHWAGQTRDVLWLETKYMIRTEQSPRYIYTARFPPEEAR